MMSMNLSPREQLGDAPDHSVLAEPWSTNSRLGSNGDFARRPARGGLKDFGRSW
jgi:hypothetical protein